MNKSNLNTTPTRLDPWEKYYEIWVSQGRTEDQKYGVQNFMTGQGEIMLKELIQQAKKEERQRVRSKILKGVGTMFSSNLGKVWVEKDWILKLLSDSHNA